MPAPMERIQTLDLIEKDVITCLQSAGQTLLELGKEKSSLKQVETHTHQFLKTLGNVEAKLTDQINYLTQVSTGKRGVMGQKGIHVRYVAEYASQALDHIITHGHIKSSLLSDAQYLARVEVATRVMFGSQTPTGSQPHEGSGYASQKVLQMAWHRLEHARSRVNELERIKNKHLHDRAAMMMRQQMPPSYQPQQM